MTYGIEQAAKRRDIVNNVKDAIGHILWTLERSPSTYAYFRKELTSLRQQLVNSELQFKESSGA